MNEKKPMEMLKRFDPENHPEKQEGEMWLANISINKFQEIGFSSKRVGKIAYDGQGNEMKSCVPVFVSIEEYERDLKEQK